jgi:hypothetical protein
VGFSCAPTASARRPISGRVGRQSGHRTDRECGNTGHNSSRSMICTSDTAASELALPRGTADIRPRMRAARRAVAPTFPAAGRRPPTRAGRPSPTLRYSGTPGWILSHCGFWRFTSDKVEERLNTAGLTPAQRDQCSSLPPDAAPGWRGKAALTTQFDQEMCSLFFTGLRLRG